MQILFPICAGIDVHKKFVVVCLRQAAPDGSVQQEIRRFSTMTADLEAMRTWLLAAGCTHVVLESTGIYWRPVANVLEDQLIVWVVNAAHLKRAPGRKTDVKDAAWLAELLQHGLVEPSFTPPREQRELRDLVRYRVTVVEDRTRVLNRIQKVLEDANLKLASVATDIHGVSAQAMLRALVAGTEDPAALAELARGKLQAKQAELEQALRGRFRDHHRFLLAELLGHLDYLDAKVASLEERIEEVIRAHGPFAEAVVRLDTIPGVDRQLAILIVAEIGLDMTRFASDKHLCAWAGLAPGQNESGGKVRAASTRKGNPTLRRAMVQAARGAARKKGSYLRALYYRLKGRRGHARAAVAVGRSIMQIVYHLLSRGTVYEDLGDDYFDRSDRERTTKRLVHRLEALGYTVQLADREGAVLVAAADGGGTQALAPPERGAPHLN